MDLARVLVKQIAIRLEPFVSVALFSRLFFALTCPEHFEQAGKRKKWKSTKQITHYTDLFRILR